MELLSNNFKTAVSRILLVTVVFCSIFLIFGAKNTVHAQSQSDLNSETRQGLQVIEKPLGLPSADIRLIVASVIRTALGLLGIIFLVLIIYAGYLWMTSQGNEEQISSAKKILKNAAIGLAIILLAYSIVSYIMVLLGVNGAGNGDNGAGNINNQNFSGSGSLGHIIRDHYPARDQMDVPRNSKIIITFYKPINMSSIAIDHNGNGIYGDCTNIGPAMVWKDNCDWVTFDQNHINITRTDTNTPIEGANILAAYENGKVYTIVLRPYDPLGSATDKVQYQVHVGKGILVDDPQNPNNSIFAGQGPGNDYYEWKFTVDTKLDLSPPHVTDALPEPGSTKEKNTIVRVSFNEAVDPTGVQGSFAVDGDHFTLSGGNVFLQTGQSTVPLGTMRSVNGYRTLEFTPSKECGTNACGGKIYCLSVCDAPGANCQSDSFHMLLKAAKTFSLTSFESIPFSGIMDVSGNALDGNNDTKVDAVADAPTPFPAQVKPDNYDWQFTIINKIDLTSPYIQQVAPGINAPYVKANDPFTASFSKTMQYDSLYGVTIDEKPVSPVPICFVPRMTDANGKTSVEFLHCPFLDAAKHYYFPTLGSNLQDTSFNCLYPGKGPLGIDLNNVSMVCDAAHPQFCCSVTSTYGGAATCCNGVPVTDATGQTCLANLKASSL